MKRMKKYRWRIWSKPLLCSKTRSLKYTTLWRKSTSTLRKSRGLFILMVLRVCVDFRDVNAATPKDMYVMSIAHMLVDYTTNNELLSFMDVSLGNQILIVVDDISKIAFRCHGSLRTFEWLVMPFGFKNAGATYQRVMNAIFHDMLGHHMEIYIDDIVVKSKKAVEHVNHLRKSFERMRLHQLKLNPLKCAFGVQAENFLGFLVRQKGVEVDQSKANAPQNKKELKKFLG